MFSNLTKLLRKEKLRIQVCMSYTKTDIDNRTFFVKYCVQKLIFSNELFGDIIDSTTIELLSIKVE